MKKNSFNALKRLWMIAFACIITTTAMAASEVTVETAGTLASLLPTTDRELKVNGTINGTDIKYLRELITAGKVTALDIAEAHIVKGGSAYYESYTTEDEVIGQYMFHECSRLRSITLPTTITAIKTNAFSKTGLTRVEIPNTVSQLGGDAFAYCNALATVVIGSRVARLDQGVFYSSAVKTAYVKPMSPPATPAYLFSSTPKIIVYTDALTDYKASDWPQYGTITGGLEDTYPREADPSEAVNSLLDTFFEDAAATQLKPQYQAMSDDALTTALSEAGMPDFMTTIAVKLKNESWAPYEKDFRIHSYKAYSDANYWNTLMKSTGGSYMGNPTGIFAKGLEPLYVFVDSDIPSDATLYLAGCVGNDLITNAKTGTRLKRGLNIIDGTTDALFYVVYTADTKARTKTLEEWPPIQIHIEGGSVNGYYDVSRHSDADYQAILKAASHERFTVKSEHALFNFKTSTYKAVWPKTIDKSISWFDSLTVWQKDLMGYTVAVASGQRAGAPYYLTGGEAIFPIYYNNPNFAIEGVASDAGYANSTPYRTSYNSVECIRNSFDVSRYELDDWCSAHECGHNNQGAINLEGGTEASNNLFSNYIRYLDGLVTSGGSPLSTVMDEYARKQPFFVRNVDSQLRMYWQLYLYYHLAQKNTSFYPNLFKALREDPVEIWGVSYNSSLKFVRKVCEVAGEDLTDFFTAYGFFIPMTNRRIEDYGSHTMTVKQYDINRTLKEIAKYPKNSTILFVEDRADYVLTTDFLTKAGQKRRDSDKVGKCGDIGQFTDYLPENAKPSSYTYLQADSLYAMEGSGGVGFVMLDADDKMVYAANANNVCIPSSIGQDFTIFSVDADGSLHDVSLAGNGAETVWLNTAGTLADSLSAKVIKATIGGTVNSTDFKYMRELVSDGNLAAIDLSQAKIATGGQPYLDNYRTASNAIGQKLFHGMTQLISIRLPEKLTRIDANAFSNSGLKEIVIPDNVSTIGGDAFAYCPSLTRVVIGPKVRTMAQGVFYSSPVAEAFVFAKTPPTVYDYLFSSKPIIHVYASSLAAYKASRWAEFGTIVGDLDDYEELTAISDLAEDKEALNTQHSTLNAQPIYDLSGRRVTALRPGSVYIRGNKKIIVNR